jgi:DNA repair protein RadD
MMLRDYQQRTIDQLYAWFEAYESGNPCLVLPTGSGKSHIVAALCKDALQNWPDTRVLMLTHVRELIEQNAEKMLLHWPGAPLGIYSAGMGRRELDQPITFAGIQSVRDKAEEVGHTDLIVIDECHLVSHEEQGGYRTLLARLKQINPYLRVIGLTATPYRLGHGLIIEKPALFDALIEPVSIEELIHKGCLSTLRSKITSTRLDVAGVGKRSGEYIESELQAAVDTDPKNSKVVEEVIQLAGQRQAWLFFCAGVQHAQNIADKLNERGIPAACVTGDTEKKDRDRILTEFKSGKIRAITNANVLTTGFDYPNIDLIALLRPTLSPGLYVQMAGRGMRIKDHTDHCLVLDFAGVVETHGPITAVQPPKKGGDGTGEAPVKVCESCNELCHLAVRECPACGAAFPEPAPKVLKLRQDDIMGLEGKEMALTGWSWRRHVGQTSGKLMLAVAYYGALSDDPVIEYFPVLNEGYAGEKAIGQIYHIARRAQVDLSELNKIDPESGIDYAVAKMNQGFPPTSIEIKRDGKYNRVIKRVW